MEAVKKYVSVVLAPKDEVFISREQSCLIINMNPARLDLTNKWISKRYKLLANIQTQYTAGSECRLRVERLARSSSKSTNFKIGSRSGVSNLSDTSQGKRVTSLLLTAGKRGSIRYNDQLIGVKCLRGGVDNYEVEIIVDETRGGISTAISLRKGQRINIGEIIEEGRRKGRGLDISKGASYTKSKTANKYTYFLMID